MRTQGGNRAGVLAALIMLTALGPGAARADGLMMPPIGYALYEYEQLAFLDWDATDSTETLAIMPAFRGDARNFAWVIPVPAVPQVAEGTRGLFDEMLAFTSPEYRARGKGWNCEDRTYDLVDAAAGGVEVVQHDLVGIYDVAVFTASDATALADTLTTLGYLHADNHDAVVPLLDDYVARDWAFVAMFVDSTAVNDVYHDDGYFYGGLQPIVLTFASDAPVFPLRVSAASADLSTRIMLFTAADHRMTFEGATATYANRFGDAEYAALSRKYPTTAARLAPGRFLTRLDRRLAPDAMDHDLVIVRADTDDEFRPIDYGRVPFFGLFVGGWALAWATWRLRRWRQAARA